MLRLLSCCWGLPLACALAFGCDGTGSGKGGTGGTATGGASGGVYGTSGRTSTGGASGSGTTVAATGGAVAGASGTGGRASTGGALGTGGTGGVSGTDGSVVDATMDGGTGVADAASGERGSSEASTAVDWVEARPGLDSLDVPIPMDSSDGQSASDSVDGSPIVATETPTIVQFPVPTVGIYDSLPTFIAAGSDGNMWFTSSNRNSISRITPDGVITELAIPTGGYMTKSCGPGDLVLGPDGSLWFPEVSAGKIASITPQGVFTELAIPAPGSIGNNMVFGADGALWFPENKDAIGRMALDGTLTEYSVPLVPQANWTTEQPEGIVIGPDGNIWFADAGGGDIARMSLTGAITQFLLPTRGHGPSFIAAGGDGNLWFADEAYRLGRITTSGVITELQLPVGDQPGRFASGPDGSLWLTLGVGNEGDILRISPDGVLTKFLIPTQAGKPTDVAVAADGKIWFTQWALDQIGYFEP